MCELSWKIYQPWITFSTYKNVKPLNQSILSCQDYSIRKHEASKNHFNFTSFNLHMVFENNIFLGKSLMIIALDSRLRCPGSPLQAGVTMLCSHSRHFTSKVPHSTRVFEWVPANAEVNPAMDQHAILQRGVEIFLAASCYGNWDKSFGSNADSL